MRKGETIPEKLRNQFTKKTMSEAMPCEQLMRAPNYPWLPLSGFGFLIILSFRVMDMFPSENLGWLI